MNGPLAAPTSSRAAGAAAPKRRLLVLEDERSMQRLLQVIFQEEGYEVVVSDDGREALDFIAAHGCDLVIQDLRMPKMDGLEFLRLLKERHPQVLSIVVTAFGTWETAVEAMRLGAYTHLAKPFNNDDLRHVVARALARKAWAQSARKDDGPLFADMIGNSPELKAIAELIKRIARTDTTVLISGESGTGKELVARSVHYSSMRGEGPFVPVNCGAFTETLLESELFGHVKGAFTNAVADRPGLFAAVDTGTLFLDEIGEMSPLMQVKLLRVLETRIFRPVGSDKDQRVDVRVIAATNRDLTRMVARGEFREDLFHRLNVIPIYVSPLRDRKADIPMLAGHFLARFAKRMRKTVTRLDEEAMQCLLRYDWPGNVRELENTIERAVALGLSDHITAADVTGLDLLPALGSRFGPGAEAALEAVAQLPVPAGQDAACATAPAADLLAALPPLPAGGLDFERYVEDVERAYLQQALERTHGNLTDAAKLLGMSFRSIRYRVAKLRIERPAR